MAILGLVVKSRRRLLLGIALVLAAGDGIWWASRAHRGEQQEYELGTTTLAIAVSDYKALPLFDDAHNAWLRDGKPLPSLAALVQSARPTGAPIDFSLPYVLVRLPENAGQSTFRHALLALAATGQCAAGIATGMANRPDRSEMVPIHQINWVRDDAGVRHTCAPR